jgi:ABC-type multidrug transport system permease subunit
MRGDIAESTKHGDKMALRGMEVSDKEFSVGFLKQFWELSKRNLVDNARNPGVFWVRAAMYVMLSLMIGTFYLNIDNGQLEVSDRVSILFYVAAFMVFMSIAVIPTFIGDRAVFTRERGNGWYSEGPYVISNTLCAVPGIFLIALISSVLIYFMVGLNDKEGRFGLFLVNLFLSLLVAESLMLVLSALIPIYIIGMALGAGIFGLFMLAEGFFVLKDNIPDYWIWAYYIAFHTYSFEMFMYTEFDGLRLKCDTAICAFPTGEDVLARYDMKDVKVWVDVVVLIAMAVGYRLIFYGIIKYAQRGKR